MADKPEIISTTRARGGVTPHVVRYVLFFSLILAVASLAYIYLRAPQGTQQGATTAADPQ